MMPKLTRRVSLKMESSLFERIQDLARRERRSISNMIIVLIGEGLEKYLKKRKDLEVY